MNLQSTKAPSAHKRPAVVDARTPAATDRQWWETFNAAARAPINGDTKAVLMALLSYANGPGHERPLEDARPGLERLMAATGLTRRPVQKKLRDLEGLGWLQKLDEGGTRGNNATSYRVALPATTAAQAVADSALESRGVPSDAPGAFLETPQGRSQRRPTDSVPTHSPTQENPYTPTPSRRESEVPVDKQEEDVTAPPAPAYGKDGEDVDGTPWESTVKAALIEWAKAATDPRLEEEDVDEAFEDLLELVGRRNGEDVAEWARDYHTWSLSAAEDVANAPTLDDAQYLAGAFYGKLLNRARTDPMHAVEVLNPPRSHAERPLFVVTRDELRDHFEPALLEVRPDLHALERQGPPAEAPCVLTEEEERARQDAGLRAEYGDELQLRHA